VYASSRAQRPDSTYIRFHQHRPGRSQLRKVELASCARSFRHESRFAGLKPAVSGAEGGSGAPWIIISRTTGRTTACGVRLLDTRGVVGERYMGPMFETHARFEAVALRRPSW
jgi:hypothetical protein